MTNNNNVKGVLVHISAESIFLDSLARVTFSSDETFEVSISNSIIDIGKGVISEDNRYIRSAESDTRQVVVVTVTEIFEERKVCLEFKQNLMNAYGMRFYPFVSSFINSRICVKNLPINIVLIDLPDSYRILWNEANVVDAQAGSAYVKHAFGEERSTYIFRWKDCTTEAFDIKLEVAVRLGGKALLRIANFPFIYWILSLFIVSVASTADKTSILLASVGAAWIFMLRQWSLSNVPQENTLLTHAYLIHGLFIPLWAASWHFLSFWSLLWTPIICAFVYLISLSTRVFRNKGVLPAPIAKYWLKKVIDK